MPAPLSSAVRGEVRGTPHVEIKARVKTVRISDQKKVNVVLVRTWSAEQDDRSWNVVLL